MPEVSTFSLRFVCRSLLPALVMSSAAAGGVLSQDPPGIRVVASNHVSTSAATTPHYETHLAVNPTNPKHLIAVSMVSRPTGSSGANVYTTFDGGRTWTR